MNKKRLSVVMAGAMLASSVAPVLAAEVAKVEVNKGALINELTAKVWAAPVFSNDAKRVESGLEGKSVYGIQIDKEPVKYLEKADKTLYTDSDLQAEIKGLVEGLKVGQVVKLVNLGYEKVTEEDANGNKVDLVLSKKALSSKYTEVELKYEVEKELAKLEAYMTTPHYESLIDKTNTKYDSANKKFVITFQTGTAVKDSKIELTTKSDKLNFMQYIEKTAADDQITNIPTTGIATLGNFKGFATAATAYGDIDNSVEAEYTIVSGMDTFKLEDLYDGLYLTTKGESILNSSKEAYAYYVNKFDTATDANKAEHVVKVYDDNSATSTTDITSTTDLGALTANLTAKDGKYSITVKILSKVGTAVDTGHTYANEFHVTATNRAQLERFARWIDGASAEVEVIAGEDRYATAVKLAKEVELKNLIKNNNSETYNIVLVNGNSLVDGLAAAPLAQYLAKEDGGNGNAPILLTKANELPRATQRYLRELIDEQPNKEITVTLVGGEAVISNNVRKQLRSLGLNVERLGGEDREATSMAVANEIGFENGAFVVGAKGEADAMSVSGYAASKIAPVVVSGFGGLSEDTIDALDGAKVNIIGGESKVSKAEEEELSAIADSVHRISGEDRKATNAAVINTFYKKSFATAPQSVIVAKDDVLIDALTAANLSVVDNAPIVLGKKSLSAEQKEAIAYNAGAAKKIYQMSTNVAREVTKAVAQALKLS